MKYLFISRFVSFIQIQNTFKENRKVDRIKDQGTHNKFIYDHSNSGYEKQFIRSIYEYCFSIMEHIHGYFITPSNPLDVSNIFTCCTFSHVKIISSAFHIFPISHIQSYYIMKTQNDCFIRF